MLGLEKVIIDLAKVTCPVENDLYQEEIPCSKYYVDCKDNELCVECWKKALFTDVPVLEENKD